MESAADRARPSVARILLITGSYPPDGCGVGDYTAGLARALSRRHSLQVNVLTHGAGSTDPGDAFVRRTVARWDWRSISVLFKELARVRPHLIHLQFPTQGYGRYWTPWLLPLLFRARGLLVVVTWHEYLGRRPLRQLAAACVADAFVVVRPGFRAAMPSAIAWMVSRREIAFIPGASAIPFRSLEGAARDIYRTSIGSGRRTVVVYFGFTYPAKGTLRLFELLDPSRHFLVLAGRLDPADEYQRRVISLAGSDRWRGSTAVMGFLPATEIALHLAGADAVILPFTDGGGIWNSSLHAAVVQGTFVLTTATERNGYDEESNTYYAHPGDLAEMRAALDRYAGRRSVRDPARVGDAWDEVARAHLRLYARTIGRRTVR